MVKFNLTISNLNSFFKINIPLHPTALIWTVVDKKLSFSCTQIYSLKGSDIKPHPIRK